MPLISDLRVIAQMVFPPSRSGSHAELMEAFYRGQAKDYDDYRRRLLQGREEMAGSLDLPDGARVIDMGGATGSNIEHLPIERCRSVTIVDLSTSLLSVADRRIRRNGWTNVRTVTADATKFEPEEPADAVTFSYSLSMMPDWFRAIDRAREILKPGGTIGVIDFYISRKWPAPGMRRHGRWARWFWPLTFGWDNVFISPDHVPYLQSRFETVRIEERLSKMPYMLGLEAPYYLFVGRTPPR